MPRQCVSALVARIARVTLTHPHGDIVPAYHVRQPVPQIVILSRSKVAPNILSVPRQLGGQATHRNCAITAARRALCHRGSTTLCDQSFNAECLEPA
jgi:hypothetical protein